MDIAAAISYTGRDIAATKIAISYQRAQVAHCGLRAPVPRPDAPTTRDRTAAHPTTHGSQTGRVDITAAISCTGKEITATKTEISASTKVISSTVPRRQRAQRGYLNGPASPSASPQKYQAQGALKTLVNCTCALLRSALLSEASRFVSLFIKFAFSSETRSGRAADRRHARAAQRRLSALSRVCGAFTKTMASGSRRR